MVGGTKAGRRRRLSEGWKGGPGKVEKKPPQRLDAALVGGTKVGRRWRRSPLEARPRGSAAKAGGEVGGEAPAKVGRAARPLEEVAPIVGRRRRLSEGWRRRPWKGWNMWRGGPPKVGGDAEVGRAPERVEPVERWTLERPVGRGSGEGAPKDWRTAPKAPAKRIETNRALARNRLRNETPESYGDSGLSNRTHRNGRARETERTQTNRENPVLGQNATGIHWHFG